VVARQDVDVSREKFESVLTRFVGQIEQVPPAYSAVKRDGKRLYEYAREGIEVEAPPRSVQIHRLSMVDWSPPQVTLDVACGPGTYVRALARDLGRALGCGATLVALRRTASGDFAAEQAVPLSEIEQVFNAGKDTRAWVRERLHALDVAFSHLPALHLPGEDARRLTMGQSVAGPAPDTVLAQVRAADRRRFGGLVPADGHSRTFDDALASHYARAYGPGGQFLALVSWNQDTKRWRPRKVFVQPSEL
jgi:tRNA pseudouridine55 synthase